MAYTKPNKNKDYCETIAYILQGTYTRTNLSQRIGESPQGLDKRISYLEKKGIVIVQKFGRGRGKKICYSIYWFGWAKFLVNTINQELESSEKFSATEPEIAVLSKIIEKYVTDLLSSIKQKDEFTIEGINEHLLLNLARYKRRHNEKTVEQFGTQQLVREIKAINRLCDICWIVLMNRQGNYSRATVEVNPW